MENSFSQPTLLRSFGSLTRIAIDRWSRSWLRSLRLYGKVDNFPRIFLRALSPFPQKGSLVLVGLIMPRRLAVDPSNQIGTTNPSEPFSRRLCGSQFVPTKIGYCLVTEFYSNSSSGDGPRGYHSIMKCNRCSAIAVMAKMIFCE